MDNATEQFRSAFCLVRIDVIWSYDILIIREFTLVIPSMQA